MVPTSLVCKKEPKITGCTGKVYCNSLYGCKTATPCLKDKKCVAKSGTCAAGHATCTDYYKPKVDCSDESSCNTDRPCKPEGKDCEPVDEKTSKCKKFSKLCTIYPPETVDCT